MGNGAAYRYAAGGYPAFRARLKERNLVAQLKARDEEIGRWYAIRDGKVTSGAGLRADADVTLAFKTAAVGADLLMPPINWLDQINAQKDFKLTRRGTGGSQQLVRADHHVEPERRPGVRHPACRRHHALLQHDQRRAGLRLCQGRQDHPHDADRSRRRRPPPWTIDARGLNLTPPRKTTLAPHGQNAKSIVYSPDRLLYPMKRVDFDPNGERNPQNRGKSAYVRISWEEALDLVAGEIKRHQARLRPGRRWRCRTAPTIPGATSAITSRHCFVSATRSDTRSPSQS